MRDSDADGSGDSDDSGREPDDATVHGTQALVAIQFARVLMDDDSGCEPDEATVHGTHQPMVGGVCDR